jgi:hypothetical protein
MKNVLLAGATGLSDPGRCNVADGRARVVAPTRSPLAPHPKLLNPITTLAELPRDAEW